jgi:hypothetical protein
MFHEVTKGPHMYTGITNQIICITFAKYNLYRLYSEMLAYEPLKIIIQNKIVTNTRNKIHKNGAIYREYQYQINVYLR